MLAPKTLLFTLSKQNRALSKLLNQSHSGESTDSLAVVRLYYGLQQGL
jgi:hypothetical protein